MMGLESAAGGGPFVLRRRRARPVRHGGSARGVPRAGGVLVVALTVWRVIVSGAGLGGRGVTCRALRERGAPTGGVDGPRWGRPQVVGSWGGGAGGGAGGGNGDDGDAGPPAGGCEGGGEPAGRDPGVGG